MAGKGGQWQPQHDYRGPDGYALEDAGGAQAGPSTLAHPPPHPGQPYDGKYRSVQLARSSLGLLTSMLTLVPTAHSVCARRRAAREQARQAAARDGRPRLPPERGHDRTQGQVSRALGMRPSRARWSGLGCEERVARSERHSPSGRWGSGKGWQASRPARSSRGSGRSLERHDGCRSSTVKERHGSPAA